MEKNKFKPFISFSGAIKPLPVVERTLRRHFLGKFVIIREYGSETYCFGRLVYFRVGRQKNLFVLENSKERIIVQNASLIKVI